MSQHGDPNPLTPPPPVGRALVDIPGTRRSREREKAEGQQSFAKNLLDGFLNWSTIPSTVRLIRDEGIVGTIEKNMAWMPGVQLANYFTDNEDTPYNKDEAIKNADPRIDRVLMEDLLEETSIEAYTRRHQRIVDELDAEERMNLQYAGAGFAHLVGSMVDFDLPVGFLTGGAFMSAKLARNMLRVSAKAGLTPGAAQRVTSAALGLNAGLQAGGIVGLADVGTKELSGWEDFAAIMLGSTVLATGIGGLGNTGKTLFARAAQQEFHARVARNDPNLMDSFDVDDMHLNGIEVDAPEGSTVIGGETPQSLGAATTGTGGRPKRVLVDPMGPMSEGTVNWIDRADQHVWDTNFREVRDSNAGKAWHKLAISRIGSFGMQTFTTMYTSKSAVLNYIGGTIFESANGLNRGRATASITMDAYHRRIQRTLGRQLRPSAFAYAQRTGETWSGTGRGISAKGRKAFWREIYLERNNRAMGRKSTAPDDIKDAADQFDAAAKEALIIGVGREGQHAVDGMTMAMDRPGFTPFRHDGGRIDQWMRRGLKRQDIEAAYEAGYRAAGMKEGKDAAAVAKAVVQRALMRDADLDGSVMTLLTGDGREFMADTLRQSGLNQLEVDRLMQRLIGSAEDRAKEGFAKSRNELDLSIEVRNDLGEDIRLVDMMEADLGRTWQRYARQMSGSAALARHGITNRLKRTEIIKAAQAEQRALGEEVMDADMLHAMFSHFNAGPVWGFSNGRTNKGISVELATAKRLANLGLLEKLGVTQLYETGAIIAQVGVANWWRRGPMVIFDKELKDSTSGLLDEVSYFIGEVGYDQLSFAEWFDWDEVSNLGKASYLSRVSNITQSAAYIQSYTSAFNHVRGLQQKVAVAGMIDKVMRTLREGDYDLMLARFESDFGLGKVELDEIQRMIDSGMIEFHDRGFVNRLNMDKWDGDLRDTFAGAMLRNMHQTVQKSMAGEQDAWMHTEWGSLMTHLITFPMQAFQKQFVRNGKHMDTQALAAMSFGLMTAFIGVNIRDAIDGRERSTMDRAKSAFAYNNMTGWGPLLFDPAMTILGFDDMRWSPYGPHASIIPPTLTQLNNLRRLPGAVINAVRGEFDYFDLQAVKAMPFAGTYFASRVFD